MRAPSQEPTKIGSVDVEEFSRNLARLIEEGGRALAAYLKPREDGRKSNAFAEEIGEVVKTLGHVAEYWLEDPQRAERLWLAIAVATLWLLRVGGSAEEAAEARQSTGNIWQHEQMCSK